MRATIAEWITYRWALRRADRSERIIRREYAKDRRVAERSGSKRMELAEIQSAERYELRMVEDDLHVLNSRRLIKQAYRMRIPVPDFSDKAAWGTTELREQHVLTVQAMSDLRAAIRNERNERWQFWELRLKVLGIVLTAATGAMGALIGLLAIWPR